MFLGYFQLGAAFTFAVLFKNAGVNADSSTTPGFRIYGPAGLQTNGTGSLTRTDSGAITGATNASPIVITSAAHGLTTGTLVTISGVLGNTAANGTFTVTVIDPNTFSLQGSTGNGAYTSGGTWTVTGLYSCSITPTQGNGYAQGSYYDVLVNGTVSSNIQSQLFRFGVV